MTGTSIESRYADVLGARMHYLELGQGDPILLLHGNPTSSFIWRDVIPELSSAGRCIAPDLIGMGRSQKPDLAYRFFDHARYLEEFIHQLKLRNVTIVGHDWGGALGFYYSMHHERNVRAIAFFETIVKPLAWSEFPSDMRMALRLFRLPVVGQLLIQGLNLFVNKALTDGVLGHLEERVLVEYARPFPSFASRKPIWRMPNDIPIDGKPSDIHEIAVSWSAWLCRSEVPKLLLYGRPGLLIGPKDIAWCRANIRKLEVADVGEGLHYLQEEQPHAISRSLVNWLKKEVIPHESGTR